MADTPRKKWIQKAVSPSHKGEFKAKAERAGKSTRAFAKEHEHDSGKSGAQARLAETLMDMHHGKKRTAESKRKAMYDHSRSQRHG